VPYRPKSADEVKRNMSAIRSRDNRSELALRSALHRRGLRFRLHRRDVAGKPDIVFARERVAVFVDGDFWHARRLREEGMQTLSSLIRTDSKPYWREKFERRIALDDAVTHQLFQAGWKVLRFWESDVKRGTDMVAEAIEKTVRERRTVPHARRLDPMADR
jgi:DNA mismatch endonuclease (patch repair protein)